MTEKEIINLGAFLHDIGKFVWRSQGLKTGDNHEKLGSEFIREHLGKIPVLKDDIEKIIDTANRQPQFIVRADSHAASERKSEDSQETRRPLISIFSKIDIGKGDKSYFDKDVYYYNPLPLSEVPQTPEIAAGVKTENWKVNEQNFITLHKKTLDSFLDEIKKLYHYEDYDSFFTTFYKLCEKYTTYISSASFKSTPDISLFDHSRNVAGLSLCYSQSENKNSDCILFKGDLSGIQNFIYYEIDEAEKAAKQLRGRSFFVSLLTDVVNQYIVNELNLYETNVLFNSGGHFILLIPNNKSNRDKITEIERNINLYLYEILEGKIQLVTSYVTASGNDLFKNYPKVYEELEKNIYKAKKQKSKSIIDNIFFSDIIPNNDLDDIFEKIGQKLPLSDYLLEIKTINDDLSKNKDIISFDKFNLHYKLADGKTLENSIADLKNRGIKKVTCFKLNDTNFVGENNILNRGTDFPVSYSFKQIGNYVPVKDNKPLSFEQLSRLEGNNSELSFPSLGIIRMDVDSLGRIFSKGLEKESEKSLSRIATLSRQITNFFTWGINRIAANHSMYIVYSGGDDIFAVGSWFNTIGFALEVRQNLSKYVCNNQNITISAGTVIVKPNFPISKSAKLAGDKESLAKNKGFKADNGINLKNHISIFEREVKWNEFKRLIDISLSLDNIIEAGQRETKFTLSRSFVYQLLEMTKSCFNKKGEFVFENVMRLKSKINYHFARRNVDSKEIENPTLKFKTDLAKMFISSTKDEMKNWYYNYQIPASYVLMKTRNIKK